MLTDSTDHYRVEQLELLNVRGRRPIPPGTPIQGPSCDPIPEFVDSSGVGENTQAWIGGIHGHIEEPWAEGDACGICRELPKDISGCAWDPNLGAIRARITGENSGVPRDVGGVWLPRKQKLAIGGSSIRIYPYLDHKHSLACLGTIDLRHSKRPR